MPSPMPSANRERTPPPFTLRERWDHARGFAARVLPSWRFWAVIGGAVVLFSASGAFRTGDEERFLVRLIYWSVTMAATSVVAIVFVAAASALSPREGSFSFATLLAGAIASCLPNTVLVRLLIPPLLAMEPPGWLAMFLSVLPVGVAVAIVTWLAFDRSPAGEAADGTAADASSNPLLERLPVEKRGDVVRMSMQDHYVEVVTTRGRELVLMRMADAAAAMGAAGLRIHRSHWVSRDHVTASRREGSQAVVLTSDGAELPVSRSYLPELRSAGLL